MFLSCFEIYFQRADLIEQAAKELCLMLAFAMENGYENSEGREVWAM